MVYVKIIDNVVAQTQPNQESGFKSVNDSIKAGMVHDGSTSYAQSSFSVVPQVKSWDDVTAYKRKLIVGDEDVNDSLEIHEREVLHQGTPESSYTISETQYQSWLNYFQEIRAFDSQSEGSPEDALAALSNVARPA